MDRNLTERLKKLSQELADAQHKLKHLASELSADETEALQELIDDLDDKIWDIEDQLEADAQDQYGEQSAKGWN